MTLSSHLRLFISGSLVTIGGNVALGLINYLVRRTMVWRLTETDFGLFWGTFSLVTLVCALADLGIVNSGTLLFAEKKEEPREIFSAVLLLKLV